MAFSRRKTPPSSIMRFAWIGLLLGGSAYCFPCDARAGVDGSKAVNIPPTDAFFCQLRLLPSDSVMGHSDDSRPSASAIAQGEKPADTHFLYYPADCAASGGTGALSMTSGLTSICETIDNTLAFMSQQGFVAPDHLAFSFADGRSSHPGMPYIGHFDPRKERIRLMTFDALSRVYRDQTALGVQFDADIYASFIAHEVAHAVINRTPETRQLPRVLQEYGAYCAQLAMMSDDVRSRVLKNADVAGFERLGEASETYLCLNPGAFAVKSYKYFMGLDDKTLFGLESFSPIR